MSSTIPLSPREQLCNRYCSNKHTHQTLNRHPFIIIKPGTTLRLAMWPACGWVGTRGLRPPLVRPPLDWDQEPEDSCWSPHRRAVGLSLPWLHAVCTRPGEIRPTSITNKSFRERGLRERELATNRSKGGSSRWSPVYKRERAPSLFSKEKARKPRTVQLTLKSVVKRAGGKVVRDSLKGQRAVHRFQRRRWGAAGRTRAVRVRAMEARPSGALSLGSG